LASAQSDIETYQRISRELLGRRTRLAHTLRESSNSIDFRKEARSNAYANFKEFDGRGIGDLVNQQHRIKARIALSKQTSDEYQIWAQPPAFREVPSTWPLDHAMYGEIGLDLDDGSLKMAQREFQFNRYLLLGVLESSLKLKPACSFWRLAMRTIFDDNKTVVEISDQDHLVQFYKIKEILKVK
jgi:hypothetical protein